MDQTPLTPEQQARYDSMMKEVPGVLSKLKAESDARLTNMGFPPQPVDVKEHELPYWEKK